MNQSPRNHSPNHQSFGDYGQNGQKPNQNQNQDDGFQPAAPVQPLQYPQHLAQSTTTDPQVQVPRVVEPAPYYPPVAPPIPAPSTSPQTPMNAPPQSHNNNYQQPPYHHYPPRSYNNNNNNNYQQRPPYGQYGGPHYQKSSNYYGQSPQHFNNNNNNNHYYQGVQQYQSPVIDPSGLGPNNPYFSEHYQQHQQSSQHSQGDHQ